MGNETVDYGKVTGIYTQQKVLAVAPILPSRLSNAVSILPQSRYTGNGNKSRERTVDDVLEEASRILGRKRGITVSEQVSYFIFDRSSMLVRAHSLYLDTKFSFQEYTSLLKN